MAFTTKRTTMNIKMASFRALSAAAVDASFFDGVPGADLIDVAAVIVRRDASGTAWFK